MAKSEDKLDGYTLTEKLRKARRRHHLSAATQALYHELVAICNEEGWSDVFRCSNGELCTALCIDEKTLTKHRLSLIQCGLLNYKSGQSKKTVGIYSFLKRLETTGKIPTNPPTNVPTNPPAQMPAQMPAKETTNAPDLSKTKTETKQEDDIPENLRVENAESFILQNPKEFDRITKAAKRQKDFATDSLHKYHLHLIENAAYPKNTHQILAGFEKWLLNEKRKDGAPVSTAQTQDPNDLLKKQEQQLERQKAKYGA